jgi:hypothetical protein
MTLPLSLTAHTITLYNHKTHTHPNDICIQSKHCQRLYRTVLSCLWLKTPSRRKLRAPSLNHWVLMCRSLLLNSRRLCRISNFENSPPISWLASSLIWRGRRSQLEAVTASCRPLPLNAAIVAAWSSFAGWISSDFWSGLIRPSDSHKIGLTVTPYS